MSTLTIVVLGIVQGLTEFLPISSSGHLVLAETLFGMHNPKENLTVTVALHLGSLFAILLYYFRDFLRLLTDRRRELGLLMVGSIPAAVVGVLFEKEIEETFASPVLNSVTFILNGLFLWWMERQSRAGEGEVTLKGSFVIGAAQAVAILPAISRSGMTIGTAVLQGVKPAEAVRFSFFLGAIAIGGAQVLKAREAFGGQGTLPTSTILLGVGVSLVVSLLSIGIVRLLAERRWFRWFGVYCVVVGVGSLPFVV